MSTYCEGSDCSKRDKCALHNPGEGTHEYIDWSTYGSGRFWQDKDGKRYSEIEHSCGDKGDFKKFVPVRSEKELQLIEDINRIFRDAFERELKPADLEIIKLMQVSSRFVINELWYEIIRTIKKYEID